jgi:hypothetical protein
MLVAARPTFVYVVHCVVSTVLNTASRPLDLWFGWLVHFKVHYQKSQCKMFWSFFTFVFKFSFTEEEIHFLLLFLLFLLKCYNMKYFAYVSVLGDVIMCKNK